MKKSEATRKFYNDLVDGKVSRSLWGKEKRFSPESIAAKSSVFRYYTSVVMPYLKKTDNVLDLGCGPGGFLAVTAPLCGKITGADITPNFIEECNNIIKERNLANAEAVLVESGKIPFPDGYFETVVMVDTIHHLENAAATMEEVFRILKQNGLLLIFEPNKLNPLLFLMCCLDKNEHGLLKLGTIKKYKNLLETNCELLEVKYNGLLIGPESRLSLRLADICSSSPLTPLLGWLSPKMFLAAKRR